MTDGRAWCWVQVVSPVDPRIHFALVCGAKSCPPIKVYTPTSLQEGLDSATMAFCEGQRHQLETPPIGFIEHVTTAAVNALSCQLWSFAFLLVREGQRHTMTNP